MGCVVDAEDVAFAASAGFDLDSGFASFRVVVVDFDLDSAADSDFVVDSAADIAEQAVFVVVAEQQLEVFVRLVADN